MKSWIAFAVVFGFFAVLGGLLFSAATSAVSGGLYWLAFLLIGFAAAQKAKSCFSPASGEA